MVTEISGFHQLASPAPLDCRRSAIRAIIAEPRLAASMARMAGEIAPPDSSSRRVSPARAGRPQRRRALARPAQQLELSARALDQRRARFHPVAGVAVESAGDLPHVGTMDVST